MGLSYLVSTAGHALDQNEQHPHHIRSILQLIEEGAEEFGLEKVVGFTSTSEDGWVCHRYSFNELLDLSGCMAGSLLELGIEPSTSTGQNVSLLCPTGLEFLIAWIALLRLGYGVVLVAPQCSPSAIDQLLTSSSSSRLVYHPKYADLAQSAQDLNQPIPLIELPPASKSSSSPLPRFPEVKPDSISHIFHSSGTSGNPKPIPHTHLGSVTILPRRALPTYLAQGTSTMPRSESAAFTTTPLFHGGISDLLRAWMARSMIYFYPTSTTSVTASNVVGAVDACQQPPSPLPELNLSQGQLAERTGRFRVTTFLSVPYILSILAEDKAGVEMLKSMDMVSTGGAPLNSGIGDALVDQGVHLVSRLGSSECGFLLSSHRDYQAEKDWEWLRNDSPYADALQFERFGNEDKYEMVVTERWKSKTKSNRDDGSYATGDLYQPHPNKPNVWRYVGRGDDVIVMDNGEKATPGPIEAILTSSPLLSDALVVGAERSQLGLLLFPHSPPSTTDDLLTQLGSLIQQSNAASPSFAQIALDMCIVTDGSKALPKSSKGTIQRGVAYEVFKEEIDAMYGAGSTDTAPGAKKRDLREIEDYLLQTIKRVAGSGSRRKIPLDRETDLFNWGVDSLMATRIRTAAQRDLDTGGQVLPRNVVFEKPSIARLGQFIFDLQEQKDVAVGGQQDNFLLMEHLAVKYGDFGSSSAPPSRNASAPRRTGKTIVLTGATGSLGAFIVQRLCRLPVDTIRRVICLVRAEDNNSAMTRIRDTMQRRSIEVDLDRVEAYAADLTQADLGLPRAVYQQLVNEVDVVVHAAWPVHFTSSLVSFEGSIKGTRHLIDLVAQSDHSQLYYCSSLASVLAKSASTNNDSTPSSSTNHIIGEAPSEDPSTASPIGYSQSKWVTEKVCRLAAESDLLRDRVHIMRIGQLCGDTVGGYWNEKEGWPLMIKSAEITGCLPILTEKPSWLPVDLAAQAVTDIILNNHTQPSLIYHVVHPLTLDWMTVLDGLSDAGLKFDRIQPELWLEKMDQSPDDPEANPSKEMLGMWQGAYGKTETDKGYSDVEVVVETTNARAASPTLEGIRAVGREDIVRMVHAWRGTGFLH